ncbi:hypothetical protein [Jiulongibacter sp. NS-SX5]|uniref:hypothetical protein n=1 Tax=Jiulongibacter sp. NS-SX5 TaxID=3463854 RepID=UPI00405A1AD3
MKKSLFLIGTLITVLTFAFTTQAQGPVPCVETLNSFFHEEVVTTMPEGAKPKILNRLGTNPQFGRIRRHTAASAYSHLKGVKKRSRRNGRELDRLLQTLGYSGIEDPEFGADDITPVIVSAGEVGWMGSGSDKYFKAQFGKDFEGFKIFVKEGPCFIYIMKTCGNIFYVDPPSCEDGYPCPECLNASAFTGAKNPFCECTPCPECQETLDQTINVSGAGEIKSGDRILGEKEVMLAATYGGETICIGSQTIPVNVVYEYLANGSASASEVVTVDNQDGNAQSSLDMKIPVNLDFDVTESQTTYGDNGMVVMDVTAKRFAALKKFYGACPADISGTAMETIAEKTMDVADAAVSNEAGDGKAGLKKQTLIFAGQTASSEIVSKEYSTTMTVIAHSTKTGKLSNGESAERYLCLGQYLVPGASAMQYTLTGTSNLTTAVEVCDAEGDEPSTKNIALPIDLDASFTKQEMKAGHDGKIYIDVTEKQFKKLAKRFSRCCSNGDSSCY